VSALARSSLTVRLDPERFPRRVFAVLLATEGVLVLLDLAIAWLRLVDVQPVRALFNLGSEHCLGNWFSSTQTLGVGLVVAAIAAVVRSTAPSHLTRRGWTVVAVFFLYMAVDDGAAIHERVGSTVKYLLSSLPLVRDYPSYTWQVALGPMFAALGALTAFVVWRDVADPRSRRNVLIGLACYAIKVAIDFVEGLPGYEIPIARALGDIAYVDAVAHFQRVIEESFKMVGTSFLMLGFLRHLASIIAELGVRFEPFGD
jgi:hypothetical protein